MTTALSVVEKGGLEQYLREISRYRLLSRDEELELARRWRDQQDVAAAHQLVVSNLRFVVKVANEYRGYGLKLLDLVQEGNVGLMRAVKKFDPGRGYRLISYAVWWIRAQIHDFILRSWSLVKLGSGRVKRRLFFKLRSERAKIEGKNLGVDSAELTEALAEKLGVEKDEVSAMEVRLASRDFSLDAPLSTNSSTSHIDRLDGEKPDPEQMVGAHQQRALLGGVLAEVEPELNDKEKYVLQRRLLSDEPQTLAEIGEHYGVSRERVRQIEGQLLKKLRRGAQELKLLPAAT